MLILGLCLFTVGWLSFSLFTVVCLSFQVTHVVLFDFPHTIADYLHRVGRTGRVSSTSKCRASILMNHRKDVRIAWEIKVVC